MTTPGTPAPGTPGSASDSAGSCEPLTPPTLPDFTRRQLRGMAASLALFADLHAVGDEFARGGLWASLRVLVGLAVMRAGRRIAGRHRIGLDDPRRPACIRPASIPSTHDLQLSHRAALREIHEYTGPVLHAATEGLGALQKRGGRELAEAVTQGAVNLAAIELAMIGGPCVEGCLRAMTAQQAEQANNGG